MNDVGYLPDGTPLNQAGNAINHPESRQSGFAFLSRCHLRVFRPHTLNIVYVAIQETIGADPHSPGSPLPAAKYAADVGYLVDGTPLDSAGNNAVH